MSEYKESFDREFLQRTKKLIELAENMESNKVKIIYLEKDDLYSDVTQEYNYGGTLILNCASTVMCLLERKLFDAKNGTDKLDDVARNEIEKKIATEIRRKCPNYRDILGCAQENISDKMIIKCLRNGLGHVRVDAENQTGVRLEGFWATGGSGEDKTNYVIEFHLDIHQLKCIAQSIITELLNVIK